MNGEMTIVNSVKSGIQYKSTKVNKVYMSIWVENRWKQKNKQQSQRALFSKKATKDSELGFKMVWIISNLGAKEKDF